MTVVNSWLAMVRFNSPETPNLVPMKKIEIPPFPPPNLAEASIFGFCLIFLLDFVGRLGHHLVQKEVTLAK